MRVLQVNIVTMHGELVDDFFVIDEQPTYPDGVVNAIRNACEQKLNCADTLVDANEIIEEMEEGL